MEDKIMEMKTDKKYTARQLTMGVQKDQKTGRNE
jgi:hypothetical protein